MFLFALRFVEFVALIWIVQLVFEWIEKRRRSK